MTAIKLQAIDIYHPEQAVNNQVYLEHFAELGRDIGKFLEIMGRSSRYIITEPEENTLTMGVAAAKKVMDKAGLTGNDIDMLVFSTQVPETLFPTNAVYARDLLGIKGECLHFDSNANCAGMTVAVDQASRYMLGNKRINRALIIGSDYNTLIANPDQEITYANYGDAAVAVILEKVDEGRGFIDSLYYGDAMHKDKIRYPALGLADSTSTVATYGYIDWIQFDASESLSEFLRIIDELIKENGFTPADIKAYCLSQFAWVNIEKTQEHFKLADEQIAYVGDRYGYTGTSSPFLALYHAIEDGRVKAGDTVMLATTGAGYQHAAVLITL